MERTTNRRRDTADKDTPAMLNKHPTGKTYKRGCDMIDGLPIDISIQGIDTLRYVVCQVPDPGGEITKDCPWVV